MSVKTLSLMQGLDFSNLNGAALSYSSTWSNPKLCNHIFCVVTCDLLAPSRILSNIKQIWQNVHVVDHYLRNSGKIHLENRKWATLCFCIENSIVTYMLPVMRK